MSICSHILFNDTIVTNLKQFLFYFSCSAKVSTRTSQRLSITMQRDAYAALFKSPFLRKTPIRIMQLNGRVSHENVTSDFFIGYKCRRIALMTYTAGQDPKLPRLPRDIIVPTYDALQRIHQPHFMYQLLPLLTSDVETFAAMQAICSSSGSPFALHDRIDAVSLNYNISNLCAGRDKICEFLKADTQPSELMMPTATRRLPILSINFQGILLKEKMAVPGLPPPGSAVAASPSPSTAQAPSTSPSSARATPTRTCTGAVLITTHDSCTELYIRQRAIMTRLFRSPLYPDLIGNSAIGTLIHSSQYQWHVMAIKRRVGGGNGSLGDLRLRAHLVQCALKENLLLYEKVDDGVYEFVQ